MKKFIGISILIVVAVLLITTDAFAEKHWTLNGQLEWVNSPAGNLLMSCGPLNDQGVGTWTAVGELKHSKYLGLYKITKDVFEMRRQVEGNMGQDVLEMVVRGAWKLKNPPGWKHTFIYVDNLEDDDQDRDVAVFKILMQLD